MSDDFARTSVMHKKPHTPEHKVRIYDMGDVHVVCDECGMHDWGDFGKDEAAYTVEAFRAKYDDRVVKVETFEDAATDIWECPKHPEYGYQWNDLTAARPDGTRGHMSGPHIDGEPASECPGPVNGPVKGY